MTRRIITTAAVAAAGGAVAFGAYGIGSQAADGDATAASGASRSAAPTARTVHFREHPGLASFADELGVSESKLRTALRELHSERDGEDRHAEMAGALADALGKPADDVARALEEIHGARHEAFAAALAKDLGVDAAKVASALDENKPDGRRRPSFGALAEDIGVTRAELRSAFRAVGREQMARRDAREDHGAELAEALGVTEEQLEDAFEKLEDTAGERHLRERTDLAEELAAKLGISAEKVERALPAGPFGIERARHRGPGGHGHGGPVAPFGGRP